MSSSSSVPLARQEEKKKEGDVKVKAPVDPPYKIFAIQKHAPSKVYHVFGKKFVFNYPISSLVAMSFLFGWLDQNVLAKYGFMCTMQTANLIFLAINIYPNNNEYYAIETDSRLLVINFIFGSFGGCFLSLGLLEYTQNRTMTFAILMTILCAMCFVVDFISYYRMPSPDPHSKYNYLVILLSIPACALFHWSSKLGYLLNLQTGNIMKIADALYRRMRSFPQGGATLRGDVLTLSAVVLFYFIGGLLCAYVRSLYSSGYVFAFVPLGCTWPFQLWLGNAQKLVGIDVHVWDYIENKFHQWSLHEDHEEALLSKLEGSGFKIKDEGSHTEITTARTDMNVKKMELGQVKSDGNGNSNGDDGGNGNTLKKTAVTNDAIINSRKKFSIQTLSTKHLSTIETKEVPGYNLKEDALYSLNSRHRDN